MPHGIFHAYGLFWRMDEISWNPGKGNRRKFRLLGRKGSNQPGLKIADFRPVKGIYILYGNYGPHYAGLTLKQNLGTRLKQHLTDKHEGVWDRFSWFSFQRVLVAKDKSRLQKFGAMPDVRISDPKKAMRDIEALLIKAMDLKNVAQMKFAHADEWQQIKTSQEDDYLAKLG